MKKFFNKWLNWVLVIIAIVCLGVAGYYGWRTVESLPTMNPVKQAAHKLTTQDTKSLSASERQRIADEVMVQNQKGSNLTKQGYIAIPDMSIFLPIYDNAYSQAALDLGANTANKDTPVPVMGEGNYTLAAHNWDNGYTGFSALQQNLKKDAPYLVGKTMGGSDWLNGKKIYMANAKGIYTYTVKSQTTVDQDDVSVLDVNARIDNQPKLTIITCLFPSTTYRIITNAQVTDFVTWKKAPATLVNYFDTQKVKANILP